MHNPDAVQMLDPRVPVGQRGRKIGVIGFYYPGRETAWDKLCGAPFLGNFWDVGKDQLRIAAPNYSASAHFSNSEAAYQALKFWHARNQFAPLSGEEAFQLKRQLETEGWDLSCGGYGSTWNSMRAVLNAKYAIPAMGKALLQTGDAFLLEHSDCERDKVWSDNCKGDGLNWLGLQLMLVRDELSGKNDWTTFLNKHIDFKTGDFKGPDSQCVWQDAVKAANAELMQALAEVPIDMPVDNGERAAQPSRRPANSQPNRFSDFASPVRSAGPAGRATPGAVRREGFQPRPASAGAGGRRQVSRPVQPTWW